jgi:predicted transcriptional regulator
MNIEKANKIRDRIRIEMIKKNIRTRDISSPLSITRNAVNQVISGYNKTGYIRQAIAKAIDMDYAALWGEYPPDDIV